MNHYYVKLTHLFSELQDHNFQYRPVVTSQPDRNAFAIPFHDFSKYYF